MAIKQLDKVLVDIRSWFCVDYGNVKPNEVTYCIPYLVSHHLWALFTKTNRRRKSCHHFVKFGIMNFSPERKGEYDNTLANEM